jgi:hypothetical protein
MSSTSAEAYSAPDGRSLTLRRADHADHEAITSLLRSLKLPTEGAEPQESGMCTSSRPLPNATSLAWGSPALPETRCPAEFRPPSSSRVRVRHRRS